MMQRTQHAAAYARQDPRNSALQYHHSSISAHCKVDPCHPGVRLTWFKVLYTSTNEVDSDGHIIWVIRYRYGVRMAEIVFSVPFFWVSSARRRYRTKKMVQSDRSRLEHDVRTLNDPKRPLHGGPMPKHKRQP